MLVKSSTKPDKKIFPSFVVLLPFFTIAKVFIQSYRSFQVKKRFSEIWVTIAEEAQFIWADSDWRVDH